VKFLEQQYAHYLYWQKGHEDMQQPWCPVAATLSLVDGKWKPMILLQLKEGPKRFNELRRLLPHVTQRMLTLQLRALENDGMIWRKDFGTNPPHVEYGFTPRGLTLGPILAAMEEWGEELRPNISKER
jgi:DNA-binding HxlR family transcriptional regulator